MADSTASVEIEQFAEVLNGFTSFPAARLTALLEGAVCLQQRHRIKVAVLQS